MFKKGTAVDRNRQLVAQREYDLIFFFQAEDGIRDGRVTGVQTCALPISNPVRHGRQGLGGGQVRHVYRRLQKRVDQRDRGVVATNQRGVPKKHGSQPVLRSEERRVGKEGGGRGSTCNCKKRGK